ncbi:MAG: TrmB family transcriptional regulator [Thermoclostridium sp.]|nr:TrmB family transcriptional regulator [Thermoclostridium sp.]
MDLLEALIRTGLTKSESELYVALNREGELTGYEAAKVTGIPRANTYQSLASLVEKGGAFIVEGKAQKFTAVPPQEYCRNMLSQLTEVTAEILRQCPGLRKQSEPYITINGFRHIVLKIKNIIQDAKERVYISVSEADLPIILPELENAIQRGLKVVAITSGNMQIGGAILYKINRTPGQIRLIADSTTVLTGAITGSIEDTCLFSKNKPLVELIKESLKNEIKLAEQ